MPSRNGMSMLPPGMDGRARSSGAAHSATPSARSPRDSWPQRLASPPPGPAPRNMERQSANSLRNVFQSTSNQPTIRAVTPDPDELTSPPPNSSVNATAKPIATPSSVPGRPQTYGSSSRILGPGSPGTSPRGTLGSDFGRRKGVVFNDYFDGPYDNMSSSSSSPPQNNSATRQRTHTLDGPVRQTYTPITLDTRNRVSSFSSPAPPSMSEDLRYVAAATAPASAAPTPALSSSLESARFATPSRTSETAAPTPTREKDKRISTRRLIKRQSSRPTFPLISPPPSVDSLPLPVPTDDANRVLQLMQNLCGRMRGEIEYQTDPGNPWMAGICYIEEEKGSLLFDSGSEGPFHTVLVPDLRGCRVLPIDHPELGKPCLELLSTNPQSPVDLLLRPIVAEELDLWLAALLCWQQLRPVGVKLGSGIGSTIPRASSPVPTRPELRRLGSTSSSGSKAASIIKVGKVMLWDKGLATSPRAIVKRPSTRDLRSPKTSWRRVSCILQDNGEFKLLTENDVTVLSVIELPQLSRSAIQQLDRTVLDEEYCIAIFPMYASTSTQLSIFRPVYLALDTRVHFEVWFVLLRAFAVPDMYRLDPTNPNQVAEVTDMTGECTGDFFRLEKTLGLRVTEAKLKPRGHALELNMPKNEAQDALVGNYLAEVILDGEVRARTTTKMGTRNPFWREDCEFSDLPPALPYLSIILKRVDGNLDSLSHQLQASLGLPRTGNLTEVLCGSVDIPLDQVERGKDHEQWLQIFDDKQQSIGTMFVKIRHEELVVLPAKEYQALSELLHRFPSGLTTQIADALPSNPRRLAEIFLNIFQVSGAASEWLMTLVEDEIDGIGNQASIKKYRFSSRLKSAESVDSTSTSYTTDREQIVRDMGKSLAGEANLLFRGNSLLTQSLEFHMRRLGKEYLEDILLDKIFEINEINPNCEVDPGRIQPGEDISQHWELLQTITMDIWKAIAASATRLPPELRHILKYIRAVAEDRYGDFLRTVTYTSVTGFLFLRFICPALLSPKLFGLLRDLPRPRAQRTFTLVAKALQALANLSSFGQKESWMEPMNQFLNSQRQAVKDFIDELCSIPAERSTCALPASYSTPITILGRQLPIPREGFPTLPYLIDHARNFAALVKLWVDLNPLRHLHGPSNSSQSLIDGDLLIFNDLCMGLQEHADLCLTKLEILRNAETASQSPSDLAEMLEHASFLEATTTTTRPSSPGYIQWGTDNDSSLRPPGSSGSDVESEWRGRRARETNTSALRHVSAQSTQSETSTGSGSGTLRASRNGRTKGILSGIMRIGRGESPDASSKKGKS